MDKITLFCLAEWFILVGRRLELIPPARATFVERPLSDRAEAVATQRHNFDSVNIAPSPTTERLP